MLRVFFHFFPNAYCIKSAVFLLVLLLYCIACSVFVIDCSPNKQFRSFLFFFFFVLLFSVNNVATREWSSDFARLCSLSIRKLLRFNCKGFLYKQEHADVEMLNKTEYKKQNMCEIIKRLQLALLPRPQPLLMLMTLLRQCRWAKLLQPQH